MFKGIALILIGLVLLFFPHATILTLIFIMGVYWIVDGIATIIKSIKGRETHKGWGWGIFVGILGLLAGIIVLSGPTLSAIFTTTFLMWFIGVFAIVYGVSEMMTGYKLPKDSVRTSMIWGGLFSILFGIVLLIFPYSSALTIIISMGIIAVIGGITLLVIGSKMKKVVKEIEQ